MRHTHTLVPARPFGLLGRSHVPCLLPTVLRTPTAGTASAGGGDSQLGGPGSGSPHLEGWACTAATPEGLLESPDLGTGLLRGQ